MHSLFRTPRKEKQLPTPTKSFSVPSRERVVYSPRPDGVQEFGQLQAIPSHLNGHLTPPQSPLSPPPVLPPKYTFAPTKIVLTTSSNSVDSFAYSHDEMTSRREYGLLAGVGSKVTLCLGDVSRVVRDVGAELGRRGVTTPMLLSNQALELNPTRARALIHSYLDILRTSQRRDLDRWTHDLAFAKDHELAWLLRWALSRVVRLREGTRDICHGLLEWEMYEEWRGRERASNYPIDAFAHLAAICPSDVYHLVLVPLLSLLSRFAAYSHLSGLTPHTLSSLFAPLLFDVPTSTPCLIAHAAFVRAASATEHLLLSYIRSTGKGEGLGVTNLPGRLQEWVTGYPAMVASDADLARAQPRRGARTVRCERASRVVRAYSRDLIASAETWAGDSGETWPTWDRVILSSRRGEASRPKFSPAWRKRMGVKETPPLPATLASSSGSGFTYGRARRPTLSDKKERQRAVSNDEEAKWGSLAGKEWSMFEEGGFDAPLTDKGSSDIKQRLQFDLNESAKLSVSQRRQTMDWTEFASPAGGFNRTDPVLDVSLSFAAPLSTSITEWPKEREDLNRRLHKSQKEATPFEYDTTPHFGNAVQDPNARPDQHGRVLLEEAFVDCYADWMMGGGWLDRDELTFKESNWAIIEYRARPSKPTEPFGRDPLADPRTSELYFLFEERVPMDYQMAVADPKEKRTFATLFSRQRNRKAPSPAKQPKLGPGWEDSDFDRMLMHRGQTKKLSLSQSEPPHATIWQSSTSQSAARNSLTSPQPARARSNEYKRGSVDEGQDCENKTSFFSKNKDRVVRRVKTDEATRERARRQREREVDFEIHSASGVSSPDESPRDGLPRKPKLEEDKWMDILVANGAKPMNRQRQITPPSQPRTLEDRSPQPSPSDDTAHTYRPERTDRSSGSHEYTHSPETSGSTDHELVVTPRNSGAEVARSTSSGKRKPVPPVTTPSPPRPASPTSPSVLDQTRRERSPRESPPRSRDVQAAMQVAPAPPQAEALAPRTPDLPAVPPKDEQRVIFAPTPTRDTIHNIVDTYRDSTLTSSTYEDSELAYDRDSTAEEDLLEIMTRRDDRSPPLEAPAPIFDLTPGREPSPSRYKHGEPLHFVGEESEEEE